VHAVDHVVERDDCKREQDDDRRGNGGGCLGRKRLPPVELHAGRAVRAVEVQDDLVSSKTTHSLLAVASKKTAGSVRASIFFARPVRNHLTRKM
jgi:hypothetical protein